MIIGMRIPHFYFFIGSFGQSGFYSHNVGSSLPGFFFFPTGQLEHLHDVFLILGTDLFTVLIFLQIIIPITQPQTSLIGLHQIHAAVHIVRTDINTKIRSKTLTGHFSHQSHHFLRSFYSLYFFQYRLDRSTSVSIELDGIHSHIIQITDFPGNTSRFGLLSCQFFDQPLHLLPVILSQQIERAEPSILIGQRVCLHPSTTGELIEILIRSYRSIQISNINPSGLGSCFLVVTSGYT